jgi:hypothetical protein
MTVFVDPDIPANALRQTLYDGNLMILTNVGAVSAFVEHTRRQLEALFRPHDPEFAHEYFDRAEMASMLGSWKPSFIHSDTSKALVCNIVREARLPPDGTYYDVPKPRTSFPLGHLTSGIAYAFPWHRDVWYSAPTQQINWWLPIFPVRDNNSMSFDVESFTRIVPNSSHTFDYYENNTARLRTAAQITQERQARPAALDHHPDQELVVIPAPGAVLLFSGAQLHRSIPNTSGRSRFSVDFRTVDAADLMAGRGAPLLDAHCTGTAIRDFHRVADGREFDERTVRRLFGTPPSGSMLVFDSGSSRPHPGRRQRGGGVVGDGPPAASRPSAARAVTGGDRRGGE